MQKNYKKISKIVLGATSLACPVQIRQKNMTLASHLSWSMKVIGSDMNESSYLRFSYWWFTDFSHPQCI